MTLAHPGDDIGSADQAQRRDPQAKREDLVSSAANQLLIYRVGSMGSLDTHTHTHTHIHTFTNIYTNTQR